MKIKHVYKSWTACYFPNKHRFPHVHFGPKEIDKIGRFFKKGSCIHYLTINESPNQTIEEINDITAIIAAAPETAAERNRLKEEKTELIEVLRECVLTLTVHAVQGDMRAINAIKQSKRVIAKAETK